MIPSPEDRAKIMLGMAYVEYADIENGVVVSATLSDGTKHTETVYFYELEQDKDDLEIITIGLNRIEQKLIGGIINGKNDSETNQ